MSEIDKILPCRSAIALCEKLCLACRICACSEALSEHTYKRSMWGVLRTSTRIDHTSRKVDRFSKGCKLARQSKFCLIGHTKILLDETAE